MNLMYTAFPKSQTGNEKNVHFFSPGVGPEDRCAAGKRTIEPKTDNGEPNRRKVGRDPGEIPRNRRSRQGALSVQMSGISMRVIPCVIPRNRRSRQGALSVQMPGISTCVILCVILQNRRSRHVPLGVRISGISTCVIPRNRRSRHRKPFHGGGSRTGGVRVPPA